MNPFGALCVVATRHPHRRITHSTNRFVNPASAITSRARGNVPRTPSGNQHPPSRSWTSAVVTCTAQTSPIESTATNRPCWR